MLFIASGLKKDSGAKEMPQKYVTPIALSTSGMATPLTSTSARVPVGTVTFTRIYTANNIENRTRESGLVY